MVDGGEGPLGHAYLEPEVAEHTEGLRAGDLVDEVRAYEELRLAVIEFAHGVRVPDLVEQRSR